MAPGPAKEGVEVEPEDNGLRFVEVTIAVQDGGVVQVERTERMRFATRTRER